MAAAWVRDHAPCTVADYYIRVAPLMPTHIRRKAKGKIVNIKKRSLAKEALRRLINNETATEIEIVDDVISVVSTKIGCLWPAIIDHHIDDRGDINLREIIPDDPIRRNVLRTWIKTHGFIVVSRGVYRNVNWIKD